MPVAHGRWLAERIPGVEAHLYDEDGHLTIQLGRIGDVHAWLLGRLLAAGVRAGRRVAFDRLGELGSGSAAPCMMSCSLTSSSSRPKWRERLEQDDHCAGDDDRCPVRVHAPQRADLLDGHAGEALEQALDRRPR